LLTKDEARRFGFERGPKAKFILFFIRLAEEQLAASAWCALVSFVRPWPHAAVPGERAGDPLHRTRVNAKTLGNATYTFTGPLTFVQGDLDFAKTYCADGGRKMNCLKPDQLLSTSSSVAPTCSVNSR